MRPPGKTCAEKVSLLGGLCFFLSTLEYMIPKPLPFIRLGLANFPLLLALDILPFPYFLLLVALKVAGQALISGTLFSYVFLFSLSGTAVSSLLMYALRKCLGKKRISLVGISACGAMAFNAVNLVMAYYFVFGKSIRYAAAPILALGIVTGTLLGFLCEYFVRRSKWYQEGTFAYNTFDRETSNESLTPPAVKPRNINARERFCAKNFSSQALAVAGLCMIPALLLNPDTCMRLVQFAFFFFIALHQGKKINPLTTFLIMLAIIFFNLLVPYGELLFSIGPLKITYGAFMAGLRRAATLEGLFMLSRFCVRSDLVFPGAFGKIAGESLRVFSRLAETKNLFNRKNWVESLDGLLTGYAQGVTVEIENKSEKNHPLFGRIILALVVILAWLPLIIVTK
jgi:heptaprenyl diphosphate synthase